jgi:hypothetical protein
MFIHPISFQNTFWNVPVIGSPLETEICALKFSNDILNHTDRQITVICM